MNIVLELLPMMIGTALAPIWIIIVLLILRSHNGFAKAIAFVAGATIVRFLQGIIFGYILRNANTDSSTGGPSAAVSMLLAMLGILLLISAVKSLMHEDDPDAPPPKWMSSFERAKAPALLGLGALFTLIAPKLWVFTLSAVGVIRGANLSAGDELKTFLVYMLGAQSVIILPLLVYAIAPRQSAKILQSASDWLTKYNNQITLVVSLVFGSLFLWKGLSGLLR